MSVKLKDYFLKLWENGAKVKAKVPLHPDTSKSVNTVKGVSVYDPFEWVKQVLLWSNLTVGFLLLVNVVVWVGFLMTENRPTRVIDLNKTLKQEIRSKFDVAETSDLQVANFVKYRLEVFNTYNYNSAPSLDLVRGSVSGEILERLSSSFQKRLPSIQGKGIIQACRVTKVDSIVRSTTTNRITCVVRGYINILSIQDGATKEAFVLPYRAKVLLLENPKHVVNPDMLFLFQADEVAGDANVSNFDKQMLQELKEKGVVQK